MADAWKIYQKYPFIIGVFFGRRKPSNFDVYLHFNYIIKVAEITENGVKCNGTVFPFHVRNYILGAQARSFIKQCVPHNSQFECEKCMIQSE